MISHTLSAGHGLVARIVTTTRSDGNFSVTRHADDLRRLRAAVVPGPWTWLDQVHGSDVVVVDHPGQWAGRTADAAVTTAPGCVLSIHTADCVPVVIVGRGALGVAHVGWRGIVAGVIPATIHAIRRVGAAGPLSAHLGPCIRADSYEFGLDELDAVAAVAGDSVRAVTTDGRPALDLGAAVAGVWSGLGTGEVVDEGLDTARPEFFSHRTRAERGRQATVVWLEVLA